MSTLALSLGRTGVSSPAGTTPPPHLVRPRRALTLSDLGEAVTDEENEVDEHAVRGALDLKVAEEGVGAEEVERLGDDVVASGVGWTESAVS